MNVENREPGGEELSYLDISDRVSEILDDPLKLMDLMRQPEIKNAPALELTLNYTDLNAAKWVKGWLENSSAMRKKQKRKAAIRATESQMEEAANIFASGVQWIKIE